MSSGRGALPDKAVDHFKIYVDRENLSENTPTRTEAYGSGSGPSPWRSRMAQD
jgi:hypothetical protein